MKKELSSICEFAKDKIEVDKLNKKTYISTENMLPDKSGISEAASLPTIKLTPFFKKNDILISNIRPYFKKIWYADFNGGCSNDVLILRAKPGVHEKFLYYVLSEDTFFDYATATAKGTKMPRGDKVAIMKYLVPDISYEKQEKIAKILSSLDNKISLNNEINKNLEHQAQAIFKSWFVDFEPFGGIMPEDWRISTISNLGNVTGGSTPSKQKQEYYTNNGIAWITPKDLSKNKSKFISKGEIDITEQGLQSCSTNILPKGTVLFSSRAPIGYIAIAKNEITTNQGFKSIIPNKDIGTIYVYYFLKQNLEVIENMASGSTFKEISGSTMKVVPAIIPNKNITIRFNEICRPIFNKQEDLEQENQNLTQLRNTLLSKLINGKIDVSNIEVLDINTQKGVE